jgi:hypothetical protein
VARSASRHRRSARRRSPGAHPAAVGQVRPDPPRVVLPAVAARLPGREDRGALAPLVPAGVADERAEEGGRDARGADHRRAAHHERRRGRTLRRRSALAVTTASTPVRSGAWTARARSGGWWRGGRWRSRACPAPWSRRPARGGRAARSGRSGRRPPAAPRRAHRATRRRALAGDEEERPAPAGARPGRQGRVEQARGTGGPGGERHGDPGRTATIQRRNLRGRQPNRAPRGFRGDVPCAILRPSNVAGTEVSMIGILRRLDRGAHHLG